MKLNHAVRSFMQSIIIILQFTGKCNGPTRLWGVEYSNIGLLVLGKEGEGALQGDLCLLDVSKMRW